MEQALYFSARPFKNTVKKNCEPLTMYAKRYRIKYYDGNDRFGRVEREAANPLELFVATKPRREFNVGDKISTRYDGDI